MVIDAGRSSEKLLWSASLYTGDEIRRYEKKIRKKLNAGKTVIGHYLITIASNGKDELDIIPTSLLAQQALCGHLPMIVGLAYDRKEAMELVVRIVNDCMEKTGRPEIRKWLLKENHQILV